MTEEPNLPGLAAIHYPNPGATIRGNGYSIYGMKVNAYDDKCWMSGALRMEDIHLGFDECEYLFFACTNMIFLNVRIDFNGTGEMGLLPLL